MAQEEDRNCTQWSVLELISYCQNKLTPTEQTRLEEHLKHCLQCGDRLPLLINVILLEDHLEEDEADQKLLESPQWLEWKEKTARKHARAVNPRFTFNSVASLKVAAMLLLALIPLILTYSLIFRPSYESNSKPALNVRTNLEENASDLTAVAAAFEQADAQLKENPQDQEALLKRAVSLERLFLFEDARKDYQQFLELHSNSDRRGDVDRKLQLLNAKLTDLPAQKSNRYELLDQQIDKYLAAMQNGKGIASIDAIEDAERIANEMADETGDRFGHDLVSFYSSISRTIAGPLLETRRLKAEVEKIRGVENFAEGLEKALQVKILFQQYGAKWDIEQINNQIAKFLIKADSYNEAESLIDSSIKSAAASKHIFLQAQFLFRKAEIYSEHSDFASADETIKEVVRLARPLGVPKFLLYPSMRLASMHFVNSEDRSSFEQAQKTMELAFAANDNLFPIQLTQILGISVFNLNYPSLSERYLQYSIRLAEKEKRAGYLALSLSFYGIIQSEQHRPADAQLNFSSAFSSLEKIQDPTSRTVAEFSVTGYQARAQLQAGNVDDAINLYSRALSLAKQINVQEKLALSQLHQGLGECFIAKGDERQAKSELAIAISLDTDAGKNSEKNNNRLSFAATLKSPREQMRQFE